MVSGVHADSGFGFVPRFMAISPPFGLLRWLRGEESKNPITNARDAEDAVQSLDGEDPQK